MEIRASSVIKGFLERKETYFKDPISNGKTNTKFNSLTGDYYLSHLANTHKIII